MIVREVDTCGKAKSIFLTGIIFEIHPNVNGPVKIVTVVPLAFKDVDFASLLHTIVGSFVSCVLDWDKPKCRPRPRYHVPFHPGFEVAISPGMKAPLVMG